MPAQFCSKLAQAVCQLLGVRKLATSSYHPNCNGGIERVNHTMAQMLAMVVNERQDDWDLHLPHVEFTCNNSVSAATGLAPNEVHMGRLPRLTLTVFDRTGVVGHQSLARDHLAYCDLATDRQKRAKMNTEMCGLMPWTLSLTVCTARGRSVLWWTREVVTRSNETAST